MSLRQSADLLRLAGMFPEAIIAALGFIRGLQDGGKLTDSAVREIIRNTKALAELGAHPVLDISDLLLVVRWLLRMAQQDPDSLRDSLKKMQAYLSE